MATPFRQAVYDLLLRVPKGKVTTYRDLAHALGSGAYRAVGQAMRCNPDAPRIPCHRVVASDGRIGGFSGAKSGPDIARKTALLRKEGVVVEDGWVKEFERRRHRF